jgi:hypothetical protein
MDAINYEGISALSLRGIIASRDAEINMIMDERNALNKADVENSNRISNLLAEIRDKQDALDKAAGWLRETREGWSGSDAEFDEYYEGLAELLGVEFTQEVSVQLSFLATVTLKVPVGYELDTSDFWIKRQPVIDTQLDEVEMLDSVEIYLEDVSIEK